MMKELLNPSTSFRMACDLVDTASELHEAAKSLPSGWVKFSDRRPERCSPKSIYFVVLAGKDTPVQAEYDEVAKRFCIRVSQLEYPVQVPVTWWYEVPPVPKEASATLNVIVDCN
jgi:hypothetical protein